MVIGSEEWKHLNTLGARYHDIVVQGYGKPLETRTHEQVRIANEIVERAYPYLHVLARRMLNIGPQMDFGRLPRLRAYCAITTTDDLAQEGAIEVIKRLHAYRPEHAMSSFIAWQFCHLPSTKELEILHIPIGLRPSCSGIPAEDVDVPNFSELLEYALHGIYSRIDDMEETPEFTQDPYRMEEQLDAALQVASLLAQVTPQARKVLSERFGLEDGVERSFREAGKRLDISFQRVHQVEREAFSRLRRRESTAK